MTLAPARIGRFRRGLTLFEVMLALAILAGGIAVIGELSRSAARNAVRTSDLTEAQLVCESVLAELAAGVIEPAPAQQIAYDGAPDWVYSVQLDRGQLEGLVSAAVLVERNPASGLRSAQFALVRWIPDPGLEIPDEVDQQRQETGDSTAASGNSSSPASGASNSSAPGGGNAIPSGGGFNGARP